MCSENRFTSSFCLYSILIWPLEVDKCYGIFRDVRWYGRLHGHIHRCADSIYYYHHWIYTSENEFCTMLSWLSWLLCRYSILFNTQTIDILLLWPCEMTCGSLLHDWPHPHSFAFAYWYLAINYYMVIDVFSEVFFPSSLVRYQCESKGRRVSIMIWHSDKCDSGSD